MGTDDKAGERLATETDHPSSMAERSLCRQPPEVGAVCGKVARTVLCGGRSVMDVPTAIQSRTFVIDELEGFRVEFLLGPDGKVDEMFFHQPNGTFVGRRA